MIMEQDCLLI